jgi:5-methylcytosine-specific restriction endonuclease McrA
MADAIWKEYELFCPVCNATFKQLVVLHKVPKNFGITPYLEGFVKSHDHKAWQEAQQKKAEDGGAPDAPEA